MPGAPPVSYIRREPSGHPPEHRQLHRAPARRRCAGSTIYLPDRSPRETPQFWCDCITPLQGGARRTLPEGAVQRAGGAEAPQAPELPGGVPDDELAPQGPLGPLAGGASRVLGSPHPEALLLVAQTQVRILRDYHTRNAQTASLTHMSASAPQQADGTPAGKVLQVMRQAGVESALGHDGHIGVKAVVLAPADSSHHRSAPDAIPGSPQRMTPSYAWRGTARVMMWSKTVCTGQIAPLARKIHRLGHSNFPKRHHAPSWPAGSPGCTFNEDRISMRTGCVPLEPY